MAYSQFDSFTDEMRNTVQSGDDVIIMLVDDMGSIRLVGVTSSLKADDFIFHLSVSRTWRAGGGERLKACAHLNW